MPDKFEDIKQQNMITDAEWKIKIESVEWPIEYGNIKLQIRHGKATIVVIERTVKLD